VLLVVLGAGASYDSVPEPQGAPHSIFDRRYFRPPLARELFERRPNFETVLYPQFSKAGPLVDDARQAILRGENLEDLLASYEERSQADQRARRQLLATRFYLQQTIAECANEWLEAHAGVTHYHSLLELLAREASPALFATTC